MRKLLLIVTFLLPTYGFSLSIDEIKNLAVERSASLNALEMENRALRMEESLKGKWQNPQLMTQYGTLKSGPFEGITTEISITQPIPLSNKFGLRKEIAQTATLNQQAEKVFFKNWVVHQAALSAWRVYVKNELFHHGKERSLRVGLVKKYLETRPRASVRQRVELALIGSLLIQLARLHDEKSRELNLALNDLEFWTGKKINPTDLALVLPDEYHFSSEEEIVTNNDIELVHAKNQLKISSLDAELSQKERRPDLFVGAGYRFENAILNNHFNYGILGLNIPIWDTGKYKLEAARARELRDEKNLEEAQRRINFKHQNQLELVRFSIQQLKRFPKSFVLKNNKAIHEAESGFKQGLIDVNTFLLSETQAHEVIDQVFIAWLGYLENMSVFQLMRGEEFKWDAK